MKLIKQNLPMIDWLTVTSYDNALWDWAYNYLFDPLTPVPSQQKWLQYEGLLIKLDNGNFFAGQTTQVSPDGEWTNHYAVRISGEIANYFLTNSVVLRDLIMRGVASVSRIDFQVTIEQPENWSQVNLFNDIRNMGGNANYMSSKDTSGNELATVSYGSRSSDTYMRIYQKSSKPYQKTAKLLLRAEVEYKGKMAKRAVRAVIKDLDMLAGGIAHRLKKTKVDYLPLVFDEGLRGALPVKFAPIEDDTDRRHDWLVGAVMPALQRYLNETDDVETAHKFHELLLDWYVRVGFVPSDEIDDYRVA